jgi:ArsR family transcriptional regulator
MPAYAPGELESAAAMCKALSDPSRLRLLLWLAQGEMCVSELVEREQDKLSSVSARLQLLHNAHLVTRRREMKHVFYALADQHVHDLLDNVLHHAAESSA